MSDLKHLTLEQLEHREKVCRAKIGELTGKINNENTRLDWILKYKADRQNEKIAAKAIEEIILLNADAPFSEIAEEIAKAGYRL